MKFFVTRYVTTFQMHFYVSVHGNAVRWLNNSLLKFHPQAVIVLYGFSRPFLLNEHIQMSENQAYYRRHILEVIMRVPVMCFFAGIFSFIDFKLVSNICVLHIKEL